MIVNDESWKILTRDGILLGTLFTEKTPGIHTPRRYFTLLARIVRPATEGAHFGRNETRFNCKNMNFCLVRDNFHCRSFSLLFSTLIRWARNEKSVKMMTAGDAVFSTELHRVGSAIL